MWGFEKCVGYAAYWWGLGGVFIRGVCWRGQQLMQRMAAQSHNRFVFVVVELFAVNGNQA